MDQDTKVALVTGAATGIGFATARALAEAGFSVVLADRDAERGETAADSLRRAHHNASFMSCDVSDADSVAALHRGIMDIHGRLDSACNNAGVEGEQAATADSSIDNFDQVINVNLRGVYLCLREQLRIMEQQGHGAIVNMASAAALVGFATLPAYCASKGGVVQLTKTAAVEYAPLGIRVNAICPGAIKTEMIERITGAEPETEAQFRGLHPMERFGRPQEIADNVVWLCSEGASFITGHALPVDGGMVAR